MTTLEQEEEVGSEVPLVAAFKVNQKLQTLLAEFDDEPLQLSLKVPAMDNYCFNREQFPDLCARAKFLPLVDMCCDVLGTNAMCPLYYSARTDARRQAYEGVPVWCNPPFKEFMEFVRVLEAARGRNPMTRAILVIPRTRLSYMKDLLDGDMWRRIQYWHKSSKALFLRPALDSILGCNR